MFDLKVRIHLNGDANYFFFEGQRGGGVPHLENYIRPETAEWVEFTHAYKIQSSILMLQVDSKKRKREDLA